MLLNLNLHRRKKRTVRPPVGSQPGTMAVSESAPDSRLRAIRYDDQAVEAVELGETVEPDELRGMLDPSKVVWVDVQGLGTEDALRAVGEAFGIHPLALADVVHTTQRPKTEEYAEHRYFVTRMVRQLEDGIDSEQFSLFLGHGYVLTFQEHYGDVFDPVRERLDKGKGTMRRQGADYLAYALIDAIIDGYYPILETLGDLIEDLEEQVVLEAEEDVLSDINFVRRELLLLRRAVHPQRDAVNALIRDDRVFVCDQVRVYLRDCYDHCVQLADSLETLRELGGGLLNTYLSAIANRTNEIMKVLTITASIFIPLTFLVGLYGMNFEYMPELHWRWAYPVLLVIMALTAVGLLFFLRHLGWIGRRRRPERGRSS